MYGGAVNTANLPRGRAFEPAEIWGLDTKFDDGRPSKGRMVTRAGLNPETPDCTESSPGAGDVAHGGTDLETAVYVYPLKKKPARSSSATCWNAELLIPPLLIKNG